MNGSELRTALHAGTRVYGTGIVSTSPAWPPMIARLGFDLVFLDLEHIPIPRDTLSWMCRTYAALGLAPIVRIPAPDPYTACTVLDAGAAGIIAPYLETVDQIRALRGALRLRPLKGERLQGLLDGTTPVEPELKQWLEARNDHSVMIVNIESKPALDHLDELLDVPGIDAVLVGPFDLSVNLGLPEQYQHPTFLAAIKTIIDKSRARNIGVGIHYSGGTDFEILWAKQGANLIMHSSDISTAEQGYKRNLEALKGSLKD